MVKFLRKSVVEKFRRNCFIFVKVKTVALLSLVAAMMLSSVAKTVVLADYLLNKDYIAKVLCINRNKPEMHCNGKCHLAKELKKQEEPSGKGESKTVRQVKEITGILDRAVAVQFFSNSTVQLNVKNVSAPADGISPAVFHPPCDFVII